MKSSRTKGRKAKSPSQAKRKAKPKRATPKGAAGKPAPRADFGAPVEGFFARQPPQFSALLEQLRGLIAEAAPGAQSSIKWGMPFYTLDGGMMCALGVHKSHVNLILSGSPGAFADPEGRLSGEGKTGKHLKLTSLDDLPREAVRGWLRTAASIARGG